MSLFSGKTILVTDDNESILMLFTALLEVNGATVTTASSGREMLELLPNVKPDMILLDIQMPGMDGYAVLESLRATDFYQSTPIIALTAHAMSGDREKILDCGFSGYIAKPIDTRAFPEQVAGFFS